MSELMCPMVTCVHNEPHVDPKEKKGICNLDFIELKWRFAAELESGTVIAFECLMLDTEGNKDAI